MGAREKVYSPEDCTRAERLAARIVLSEDDSGCELERSIHVARRVMTRAAVSACKVWRLPFEHADGTVYLGARRVLLTFDWNSYPDEEDARWAAFCCRWGPLNVRREVEMHAGWSRRGTVRRCVSTVSYDSEDDEGVSRFLQMLEAPEEHSLEAMMLGIERGLREIAHTKPRYAQALRGRLAGGTLQAVGDDLGVSKERIRQIERRGLPQLREVVKELARRNELELATEALL